MHLPPVSRLGPQPVTCGAGRGSPRGRGLALAALLAGPLAACLDTPGAHDPAVAQLVTTWDPLACGDPHRVAVELDDAMAAQTSASAPCELGVVTVDVAELGSYTGRVYAWALGAPIRSIMPITVEINAPVVRQRVATPE